MFLQEIFPKRLLLLRMAHNLSNFGLSGLLGLKSRTSISNLEAGRALPSVTVLNDITDLFAVSIDWLCGRIDEPYHNEILLRLEQAHIERLSVDFGKSNITDLGSLFFKEVEVHKNYVDASKRIELFSFPIRANIIFLLCWFQTEAEFDEIFTKRKNLIGDENFIRLGKLLNMKVTTPVFDITNQPDL